MGKGGKLSNAEIKEKCRALKLSPLGTMEQRLARIALFEKCAGLGLKTSNGQCPFRLKTADLKKTCAQAGISPMLENDEMLQLLVEHLKKSQSAGASASTPDTAAGARAFNPDEVVAKVIELGALDEHAAILNLAAGKVPITTESSVSVMRKAYLKLSLVLHPDRCRHPDATKAFQALVRAFERLSQPELYADGTEEFDSAASGVKTLARSNDGCVRTRLCCPRCDVPWSEAKLEGNPDYFYNFMMMGLRSFTCATCLLEFGCMTAKHKCPKCKQQFEYSAQDYHRKITCGNEGCTKKFGFYMFHCSDRVLKEMKESVKEEFEKRAKRVEQTRRRTASHRRRGAEMSQAHAEDAFCLGLVDECPRCGKPLVEFADDDSAMFRHLRECTDARAHKAHAQRKAAAAEQAEAAAKKADAQHELEGHAAWQFLGGNTTQLWMLTDGAIRKECESSGVAVDPGASKNAMIRALAEHRATADSQVYLTSGPSSDHAPVRGNSKGRASKRRKVTAASLPSNLQSMTYDQLQGVCAAHGFEAKGTTKSEVLDELTGALLGEKATERIGWKEA
eukprot:m.1424087 g.1424087  ORF g.1424087 m.1424087 type:complete len:564 (-) comp25059_c0_seq5:5-1696(-)